MRHLRLQDKQREHATTQRGFTLLYAMFVIIVVLTITSSIFTIMLKEVKIASFGADSQAAYYAAEAGGECAFYWEARGVSFGDSSVRCNDRQPVNLGGSPTRYQINLGDGATPETPCAIVTIEGSSPTTIKSRGYNTCETTRLRAERGLQFVF